jgi:GH15 family glucan-1,4-alpha-glucosidase
VAYLPIENYGIIGDTYTVALIGKNGSIDWLCFPYFDSPSVFAAILDDKKGGYFQITPVDSGRYKQTYWPDTNVLITRFLSHDGTAEIVDFMPVGRDGDRVIHDLIRHVHVIRGTIRFRMECRPAFNYGRDPHRCELKPEGVCFQSDTLNLALATRVPLQKDGNDVVAQFTLQSGQSATFYLRDAVHGTECGACPSERQTKGFLKETVDYWHKWLSKCTYLGRWREMVYRSALTLKLLHFQKSGAIVAAPTTSLPEWIGGPRNWDYRYTWIRDAGFTLYALLRIGFTEEAEHFMQWVQSRCKELEADGSLQTMYGLDGRHLLTEEILTHLEGYEGSGPVRIGNDAYRQLQLDIYGELMDAVYLYDKYAYPISYDLWIYVRRLLNWVCRNWHLPDEGIWEVRSESQHFVYSKLMCWVALDRGLRLANKRSLPADWDVWTQTRDQIYEEIMSRGWNRERQAFVQSYDSDSLDAANLIMPLVFFLSPRDPRYLKTLKAIQKPYGKGGLTSDSLVYRYNVENSPDGLEGLEGSFNMCSFWLVEALTRAGYLKRARIIFEKMLGYANHLGLYAEQTGPSGEALGNFPQAFTHVSLISAAFNLDRQLNRKRGRT